jgi:hypothetical protein
MVVTADTGCFVIVRLEYAENGVDVTGYEELMKIGTRDGLVGGEALILDAGKFRVVVAANPHQVFEEVEVPGASEVLLELR